MIIRGSGQRVAQKADQESFGKGKCADRLPSCRTDSNSNIDLNVRASNLFVKLVKPL